MLDELYDDVISVLEETGYLEWEQKNRDGKVSPFKWCYDTGGELRLPPMVKNDLKWSFFTYDDMFNLPHKLSVNKEGFIEPF